MTVMENIEIYDELLLFSVLLTHLVPIEFNPAWGIEAKRYYHVYVTINNIYTYTLSVRIRYYKQVLKVKNRNTLSI